MSRKSASAGRFHHLHSVSEAAYFHCPLISALVVVPLLLGGGVPTAPNQMLIWSVDAQKPRISNCKVGNSFSTRSLSGLWAPDAVVRPRTGCRGSTVAEIHQPVGDRVSPGVALSSTATVGLNCNVFGTCTRHQLCGSLLFSCWPTVHTGERQHLRLRI